jgi:hypothetical protein
VQNKIGPVLVVIGSIAGIALLVLGFFALQDKIIHRAIDSYYVEYEVTSDAGLESVTWTDAADPDHAGSNVEKSASTPVSSPFTSEAIIAAGEAARVEATPSGEGTATCRIVKDPGAENERVLVEAASAAPGEVATCEIVMPADGRFER